MAKKNYIIKTKAAYSAFRNKHKKLNDGSVIYEDNYMTISKFDELFNTNSMEYSDFQFRFGVKTGAHVQLKHVRGGWLDIECPDLVKSDENKIKLNPNANSLTDFVYYGSATEFVEASVRNIINTFPAELYFSSDIIYLNGQKYYMIDNQYNIDVDTVDILAEDVDNDLRYFALSFQDYNFIDNTSGDTHPIEYWESDKIGIACDVQVNEITRVSTVTLGYDSGETVTIHGYYYNGEKILVYEDASFYGCRLRPNMYRINEYYAKAPEFESMLLNPRSNPLYTAELKTPYETDYGMFYKMENYIWPATYGYNPDIEGFAYENYIRSLIELSTFYDEFFLDNAYRSMTHESMKTLDWTFVRHGSDEDSMDNDFDVTRIQEIIRLYGRTYDELKKYIDNIKFSCNVTYDSNNSAPYYFYSDEVEKRGFDALSLSLACNAVETKPLYSNESNGYTTSDATIRLFKELVLNAKYLNSIKGTRFGIETILSLFGLDRDEYEINEYVSVADASFSGDTDVPYYGEYVDMSTISGLTCYPNADSINDINVLKDNLVFTKYEYDMLEGLPLNYVTLTTEGGDTIRYAVPWFSNGIKYDGNLYFQMKGGWAKRNSMDINLTIAPNVTEIDGDDETRLYDESYVPLRFVNKVEDLREIPNDIVNKGDITYVFNMDGLTSLYSMDEGEVIEGYSHYFILENEDESNIIGFNKETGKYGWKLILESEYNADDNESVTENGKRVLYFESLMAKVYSNSPHIGNGIYDDGSDYLTYMANPFKWSMDNDNLTSFDLREIYKICFRLRSYKDNRKCWYFTNHRLGESLMTEKINNEEETPLREIEIGSSATTTYETGNFMSGATENLYNSSMDTVNPEYGELNDEAAANSIINIKNVNIIIRPKNVEFFDEFKSFFFKTIAPYLYYMIPSTTIFNISVIKAGEEDTFTVGFYDLHDEAINIQEGITYGGAAIDPRDL